jgi:hypothetical protein
VSYIRSVQRVPSLIALLIFIHAIEGHHRKSSHTLEKPGTRKPNVAVETIIADRPRE